MHKLIEKQNKQAALRGSRSSLQLITLTFAIKYIKLRRI